MKVQIKNPYVIPGMQRSMSKNIQVVDASSGRNMTKILNEVCNYYGITPAQIREDNNKRPLPQARAIFCHLCCIKTNQTHEVIAKYINRERSMITTYNANIDNAEHTKDPLLFTPLQIIKSMI
jgi:chromosomal replication initiation ATPase DnaA